MGFTMAVVILHHLLNKHGKSRNMCKRITTAKFTVHMVHLKAV